MNRVRLRCIMGCSGLKSSYRGSAIVVDLNKCCFQVKNVVVTRTNEREFNMFTKLIFHKLLRASNIASSLEIFEKCSISSISSLRLNVSIFFEYVEHFL